VSTELEPYDKTPKRRYRNEVPAAYKQSPDSRLAWLWNQKFGTVKAVWENSNDLQDRMAADLLLHAIIDSDITAIKLIFERLEGGAIYDTEMVSEDSVIF